MTVMQSTPCACCGAYSLHPLNASSALLAVCDVLVIKTLETVGKRIVNVDRSRYNRFRDSGKPWHLAHTMWQLDQPATDKALTGAWNVVPAMLDDHGCCGVTSQAVMGMLDSYTRDLLCTGTEHNVTELRYRFEAVLGLPVKPHHTEHSHVTA